MISIPVLVILVTLLLLLRRWKMRRSIRLGKDLNPGITSLPFLGHSYLFIGDNETRMEALKKLGMDAVKNGGLTAFWLGSHLVTMVVDPFVTELVLKTCLEKADVIKYGRPFMGNGSLFAPASIWRSRRKLLSSIFRLPHIKQFLPIFSRHGSIMTEQMKNAVGAGTVSVWNYIAGYTLDAICEVTLDYQMNSQRSLKRSLVQEAMLEGETIAAQRILQPWLQNDVIYNHLDAHRKTIYYKDYLWDFTTKFIKSTKKAIEVADTDKIKSKEDGLKTFLELLIRNAGDEFTEIDILEETIVLLLSGNETAGLSAAYAAVMLSRHPEVQEKVYKEAKEVLGDSSRPISSEELPRLVYLDAVIKETLRLYPPAPVIMRKVERDLVLPSGLILVPDTSVMVNFWAMHRDPKYWGDDAEAFRPERFLTAEKNPAYMPFSCGPRNCIGLPFAMLSLKTVLSTLVRSCKLLPASDISAVKHDSRMDKSTSEYPPLRTSFQILMKDVGQYKLRIEPRLKSPS